LLNKYSPLPLYHQLKTAIEERIDSGEWSPGMQVPPERELCEHFAVSRITVRRALSELEARGRLTRKQGVGTFIAAPRIEQHLARLTGFTQDMLAKGKRPSAKVLQLEITPAPIPAARSLDLSPGEETILLKRVRLTDDEPLAIETAYLPLRLCSGLQDWDLENCSLYEILTSEFGIFPTHAEQQLEAVACPAIESRLLGIRKGAPVLHIYRVTFQTGGRPFEYTESYYRGDRYIFNVELTNNMHIEGSNQARAFPYDS